MTSSRLPHSPTEDTPNYLKDLADRSNRQRSLLAIAEAQLQLVSELEGELPKHRLRHQPDYTDFPAEYSQGFKDLTKRSIKRSQSSNIRSKS